MEPARSRVLNDFPYPVAYPYALVFEPGQPPSLRRWALCFTEYQLLRLVCLPLVSQYLRGPINAAARDAIGSLNTAIAAIRSPFFSDWITLVRTLRKHLPAADVTPQFPQIGQALDALKQTAERPIGLRGQARLAPLEAILALRNATAHGGLPDEDEARRHLDTYLAVLHQVLDAFDFFGNVELLVCTDEPHTLASGRARVRSLRGCRPAAAEEQELPDDLATAFRESEAVLRIGDRQITPLYPLCKPLPAREPLYLYDGHHGIRAQTKEIVERGYIYYLGVHHRTEDAASCERLRQLLAARQISFLLDRDDTRPWTIADSALDCSRRTLEDLRGSKYFPECYVPFTELERHTSRFLQVPPVLRWPADTDRPRHVNGLVLAGLAGAGKTAFLARQVEQLLEQPTAGGQAPAPRENANLVLFLRGNSIVLRPGGLSLFRDVAEKLGIAAGGKGFGSFRELLEHLHGQWRKDRVADRRLILVLDALNEAPLAETVIREALELVRVAACYPWCKVLLSIRREWLGIWSDKLGAQEAGPLEEIRPFLYVPEQAGTWGKSPLPVVLMGPFSTEQAGQVYASYQAAAARAGGGAQTIPACQTPWSQLSPAVHQLLTNPLYLHLFMEAFRDRRAETVGAAPALFRLYIERLLQERPGVVRAIDPVFTLLLADLARPSANLDDDDCNAIRRAWADGLAPEECRLSLSPIETLAHEGLISKRVRAEGGGYRFVFQAIAEYLIYRHLVAARSPAEDDFACWQQRAGATRVFAEYAGAFAFLLREWDVEGRLASVAALAESSPDWLHEVLVTFLVENARMTSETGAERVARALCDSGGARCAQALHDAAFQLMTTAFARAALIYYQSCVRLRERLWSADPGNIDLGHGLGTALNNLGTMLRVTGDLAGAETAYRRSVAIRESLWSAHPGNLPIGSGLIRAWNNLGVLLRAKAPPALAEGAYRRAIEIAEPLWVADPSNRTIGQSLGSAFNNLGTLLFSTAQVAEAERAYCRSVEVREALCAAQPDDVETGHGLARALYNLSVLLQAEGRLADADRAFDRSVALLEALWAAQPSSLDIGLDLIKALMNRGSWLASQGRERKAAQHYERQSEVLRALEAANPLAMEWLYTPRTGKLQSCQESMGLLDEVLRQKSEHPYAAQVSREVERRRPWWLRWWRGRRAAPPDRDNPEAQVNHAWWLYDAGRQEEAVQLLDRVLTQHPGLASANDLKRRLEAERPARGSPGGP